MCVCVCGEGGGGGGGGGELGFLVSDATWLCISFCGIFAIAMSQCVELYQEIIMYMTVCQ